MKVYVLEGMNRKSFRVCYAASLDRVIEIADIIGFITSDISLLDDVEFVTKETVTDGGSIYIDCDVEL